MSEPASRSGRYPTPVEQLSTTLAEFKAMGNVGNGRPPFDEVWQLCLYGPRKDPRRIVIHDTGERRAWRKSLEATKESWRRAYEDAPDPASDVVTFLYRFLSQADELASAKASELGTSLAV